MTSSGGSDGWSCSCGPCCCCVGVPVRVHWTFFFVWILQIVITLIFYKTDYWKYIVYITVLWGPVLAATTVLHEAGHIVRNRISGGTCSYMTIWPLGGFSDTNIARGTCLQEFWVALCGPLMHLPQMFVWVVVMALTEGLDYYQNGLDVAAIQNGGFRIFFAQLSKGAIDLNMMLFFLNLLVPAYPLDAARLLASMGVHCGLSVVRAAWLLVIVGAVMGACALIAGIMGLIRKWDLGMFMLFIGIFMLWTTFTMYRSINAKQVGQHPVFQPDCYHAERIIYPGQSVPPPRSSMDRNSPNNRDIEMGGPGRTTTTTTKKTTKKKKKKKTPPPNASGTESSAPQTKKKTKNNNTSAKKPAAKKTTTRPDIS